MIFIKAEEAPSALLLAHAALLSTKKEARRKAALWYAVAATRLEKCGIVSEGFTHYSKRAECQIIYDRDL